MNETKKLNSLLNEKEDFLEKMKKKLQVRLTAKLVDDLHKKLKILQVKQSFKEFFVYRYLLANLVLVAAHLRILCNRVYRS